ncbi:hypothetical protein B0H13DRAFT_2050450 [Mycena leptocephala]|nr:hypothetical protein B0H13DRAFT_2050450 [Mycena leptocephala]
MRCRCPSLCPPLPPSQEYPTSYSPPLPLARSRVECPHFVLPTPSHPLPSLLLPTLPSFFPRLRAPLPYPPSPRALAHRVPIARAPNVRLALTHPKKLPPRPPLSKLYSNAPLSTLNAPVRLGPGAMAVSIGSGVPSGSMHRGGGVGGVGGVGEWAE